MNQLRTECPGPATAGRVLLAGWALANEMVTANAGELERVAGLSVENWRDG